MFCGRDSCMICKPGGSGDCRRRNILYLNTCDNCRAANAAAGVESTAANTAGYLGESFRSGSERSAEHLQDCRNKKEEGHMWRHQQEAHPDENVTFTMKVIKRFLSSFEREVSESIYIEVNQNNYILNQKSGFNRCQIPRLSVMMGEKEYHETLKKGAYNVEEFDQISTDKARKDRKKPRAKDPPGVLNNDIISPLSPPPGKRKKYNLKRQSNTGRVDPEECSRKVKVCSESRAPPPSNDEPKHDPPTECLTSSDNASQPPPPPPRHNFPILNSSKISFKKKQPRKKKALPPPSFSYTKLSNVFSQIRTNYPQVSDESQVDDKRKPGA